MIYIFLDIDGVLIKKGYFVPFVYEILDKDCLMLFENTLRQYQNKYKIVISSSWKEIFSLDYIKNKFSADIADHIVAATPFLLYYGNVNYYRYEEILLYLKQNYLTNAIWFAIDDTKDHYPPSCLEKLIYIDSEDGFNQTNAKELNVLLEQNLNR